MSKMLFLYLFYNLCVGSIKNGILKQFEDFAIGYGFSDQVFLVHTKQLCQPIYKETCIASLRYPLAHMGSIFEKRIDAYMRKNRRLRAIYMPTIYVHPQENCGTPYPSEISLREKYLKIRNKYIYRKLRNKYISKFLQFIGKHYLRV